MAWRLHFSTDEVNQSHIKSFYMQTLIKGLLKYNNRNASNLSQREFLVTNKNGYNLVAELDIKPDYKKIAKQGEINERQNTFKDVSHFKAWIKVKGNSLKPLKININLLSLLHRIVEGYRPNKHDKNTILLLDEIVSELHKVANSETTLYIHHKNKKFRLDDDGHELELSGG